MRFFSRKPTLNEIGSLNVIPEWKLEYNVRACFNLHISIKRTGLRGKCKFAEVKSRTIVPWHRNIVNEVPRATWGLVYDAIAME